MRRAGLQWAGLNLGGKRLARLRVGIPRALAFYEYFPLWREFFARAGADVVASPPTTEEILSDGIRLAVDEACLPVKAFYGHAHYLAPRVDVLFVPRLVSLERRVFTCPKFLGLPEMIKSGVGGLPPVLDVKVDANRRASGPFLAALRAAAALGCPPARAAAAYWRGCRALLADRARVAAGAPGAGAPGATRIAVLGHTYMVHDPVISMGVVDALRRLGAEVVCAEEVPEAEVRREAGRLPKRLYWAFARRTMGSALHLMHTGGVAGILHLVPFGCGSDALISDLVARFARRAGMPFMMLTVDEHSGTAGVLTRLEAFFDMVQRGRAG
jgi:predicted nucleotide-binding protein (sugar kinase/HSP70/actin superfamily)